ncbi:acetate kinase [Alcanivorax sp. JB21]|uniref:acetate kinase n=1 Tax=Alcanivorax limicola TaxID=2874102 RepID=UPI001CBD4F9C|nr:acetate kinase [Alcanivorax limicola]MBZ2188668.1 acetate kinase [Alcanivorax limicola]
MSERPARLVLVINCGSSSIKFALVDESRPDFLLHGLAERLGGEDARLRWRQGDDKQSQALGNADHRQAMATLLPLVEKQAGEQLIAVGHRVVHGGEDFTAACRIDDAARQAIEQATALAPLHNPANLMGIDAAMALFPQLPQIAVFDTAFHQSMPAHAYRYALPEALYTQQRVRRYGFHGTSHRYVTAEAARMMGVPLSDSGWLSAHLGNGCSTCAIQNGESRDTSMGFTPLEGLVMGTRSGDVDPNLHSFLARTLDWSLEKIDTVLNRESGLLGLSGLSNDMRELEQAREQGHAGATLAIEVFCYRLAKSLASMRCALTRLDGLIFTGGIGENSALIRARTLAHLSMLGLVMDDDANRRCVGGVAGTISQAAQTAAPQIWVVPTNEERQIALESLACLDTDDRAAH